MCRGSVGIPGLDGFGLGRRLGLFPVTRPAGIRQEADHQRTEEAGFHRHLVKPVDLDALGELIDGAGTRS